MADPERDETRDKTRRRSSPPPPPPGYVLVPNPRTGTLMQVPIEEHQRFVETVSDALSGLETLALTPKTGFERVAKGVSRMVKGVSPIHADPRALLFGQTKGVTPRDLAGGAADVLAGGMEMGTLAVPGALARAPLKVGAGLLAGGATMAGTEHLGHALGLPEEYVDLASEVLGLAGGVAAGHAVESPYVRARARRLVSNQQGEVGENIGPPPPPDTPEPNPDVVAAARALFPKLDAYGKPASFLSRKTILKRVGAAADLAPETKAALTQLAEQVGERRVAPEELHAIVAGQVYTPARVLRVPRQLKEGEKQIVGAPLGVATPADTRNLRERYLTRMKQGVKGREFYHDSGKAIMFHANEDPVRAMQLAGDLSATSSTTSVGGNAGMGVKGYNQATAGVPVVAGRYPTAMGRRIADIHDPSGEGLRGLKQEPFANNMAEGGGFLPPDATADRAVHDIWDAEAHGYVNPDGTPMRQGFGPAQHRFMDEQMEKLLPVANRRALGGFTDWEHLRAQAATWTAQQIEAGRLAPEDAAKAFDYYFAKLYAQGSREATPGPSTLHMPEMLDPENPDAPLLRKIWHDLYVKHSGIYDPQMRDQLAATYGGLVGRSFEGPGYYKGQTSPGVQTLVLTGSEETPLGLPGTRVLDEGSRRIMDAAEASHGILMGQDAYAYSKVLPAGTGAARTAWDIALPGGTLTDDQLLLMIKQLRGSDLIPVPTPTGVRLMYGGSPFTEPSRQPIFKFLQDDPTVKAVMRAFGGKLEEAGTPQGSYRENPWGEQRVGQDFFDAVRTRGTELFDRGIPPIAQNLRDLNRYFVKAVGGRVTPNPIMDEIRGAIANEGWAGLERLAKKYGIPVITLLMMGLGETEDSAAPGQEPPQEPEP
jgi:hypothetical protein